MRSLLPCAFVLAGCPPPEVLYGPEIFDAAPSGAPVPGLAHHQASEGWGQLKRLGRPFPSHTGPGADQVSRSAHIEISGEIICENCQGEMILHVLQLDAEGRPPPRQALAGGLGRVPLVTVSVDAGAFSVPVPIIDTPIAIELLLDRDGNSVPSVGERYVEVLDPAAPLRTDEDIRGVILDASDRPTGRPQSTRRHP